MRIGFIIFTAGMACTSTPSHAVDVTFSGTVAGVCTLALTLPGTLALSMDGTVLGSEEPTGVAATMTVLSVGSNTITVAAPTRTAAPGSYVATGEAVWIKYVGLGLLSAVSHGYDSATSSFAIGSVALTTILFNSKITNANGFAAGTYSTRSVVTCS